MKKRDFIVTIIFLLIILATFESVIYNMTEIIVDGKADVKTNLAVAIKDSDYKTSAYINLNGAFQRCIGRSVIEDVDSANTVYKMKNGQLTNVLEERSVNIVANELKKTKLYLDQEGVSFLYVQAPFKINPDNTQLPTGVSDYSNKRIDDFLNNIEGTVPYIDMRDEMKKNEWEDMFYITDHHWNNEGAFNASKAIIEYLQKEEEFDIDSGIYAKENWDLEVFENTYLGSRGRRTGRWYAGIDDMQVLTPRFQTSLRFVTDTGVVKEGNFKDALLDYDKLVTVGDYDAQPYYVYESGEYGHFSIQNNSADNDKKILLVKDSFGVPVSAFLSLGCQRLDAIDTRYMKEKSVKDYQKLLDPDIIIYLYNPGYVSDTLPDMFRFD